MPDNTNLTEMMGREPRVSFDVTQTKKPVSAVVEEKPKAPKAAAKPMKATPIQTGPVDLDAMETITNVNDILPPRPSAASDFVKDQFKVLDEAITERILPQLSEDMNKILDARDAEIEMNKEKEAEAEIANAVEAEKAEDVVDDMDELYEEGEDDYEMPTHEVVDRTPPEVDPNVVYADRSVEEFEADQERLLQKIRNMNTAAAEKQMPATTESAPSEPETVNVTKPNISYFPETVAYEAVKPNDEEKAPVEEPKVEAKEAAPIMAGFDDDGLFEDDDDTEDPEADGQPSVDEQFEDLKSQVKEKMTVIRGNLDLSKFSIAKKSISLQKVMKLAVKDHQNIADWVLYDEGRPISMTSLSGPEILKLNPENSGRNRLNTFRDMYRVMWDHLYDANKPEFETWLKKTHFVDLPHIYFALYKATFSGSNFMNYACPKCGKIFLKDISFEDMIEYESDEVKNRVAEILKMDSTTGKIDEYPVDLVQINDTYVFGMHTPSIWNVIIETASLNDRFIEQHADLIDVVTYIDSIYVIDSENMTLVPVDTKPDPNDQAKTTARRIKAFYEIISKLNSDEYYNLRKQLERYDSVASKVSYLIPEATCPECETSIPANREISPDNMLFTRHQLAAIGNM